MKTIGLVTFHRSNSYGACLQAYATVEFLKDNGYEVEIVDYINSYEHRFQKKFYSENGKLSGYFTQFIKDYFLKKRSSLKQAFGNPEEYYPISRESYTDRKDMAGVKYDVLIAGSDQIWNAEITNGVDPVFLLQFGKSGRRISVASSFGSTPITDGDRKKFEKAMRNFDSISTRETFGTKQLRTVTDKPVKILMDPTFFFDGDVWRKKLIQKSMYNSPKEKYIFTFFVAPNRTYRQRVQEYADKLNLPVWSQQSTTVKRTNCEKSILGARIEDLIALIANAELVITDSFHGTALSINLGTNFVSFKNTGNPVRVKMLLDSLGIADRIDMNPNDYNIVDYEEVYKKLKPLCEDSRKWVIDAVEGAL